MRKESTILASTKTQLSIDVTTTKFSTLIVATATNISTLQEIYTKLQNRMQGKSSDRFSEHG